MSEHQRDERSREEPRRRDAAAPQGASGPADPPERRERWRRGSACGGLIIALAVSLAAAPALPAGAAAAGPQRMADVVVVLKSQANLGAIHAASRPARLAAVERSLRTHAAQTQKGVLTLLARRQAEGLASSIVPLWIANEVAVRAVPAVVRELAARPDVGAVRPEFTIQAPAAAAAAAATSTVEANVSLVNAPSLWSRGFRGQGIVVANMDTGVDATHPDLAATWRGGTNSWYDPNGQHPTTPTDVSGHGTQTMSVMVGGDAAGNYGPTAGTVQSPANLPEAFAVGGTDNTDVLYAYSSRGPSACSGTTAPKLTAPAVDIRTADLYGGYALDTGTSVAAPHVAGALALLLSAFPQLSADQQEAALESGALDLGAAGIDNDFGYGRVDALAAYQWLAGSPDFTVAASPLSATVSPGGTTSYTVSIAGMNGFAGDVSLSVSGLPSSAGTATSTPTVVTGAGSSQLAVSTVSSAPPGTYPLTVTGTSGTITRTATATLVVSGPPDFTVTASPSAQSVAASGSASFTVGVGAVNGFTGDVSLSVSGVPASVGSATVTPAVITTAGSSQLTVSTVASAPPGTYPLTVTATSGSTTHTASVTLTVKPPPDFSLAATPASRAVNAGTGTTYSVTIGALNGFTGNVGLSVGLPASVGTATLTPSAITGSGTSQLAVTTYANAPGGSYPLTITGTSGSLQHSASVTLTVVARDFTLSANPSSVTVYRGQTASYAVSTSGVAGFTGSVSLTAAGLPSGATATWSSNPVATPGSTTLRVRTTGSTTRGTFTLRVTGTSGALTHQVNVGLVVR